MRDLLRALVELLLPSRCARCGDSVALAPALCRPCLARLIGSTDTMPLASPRTRSASLAALHVGGVFDDELAAWIHRFKYPAAGWRGLDAAPLAVIVALARAIARERLHPGARIDRVIPVPADARRLRRRGFHPAGEIGRVVARALGATLDPALLVTTRTTASQTDLDRAGRRRNVAGAYAVANRARANGAHLLLVDDVTTTGATLEECARTLRRAGAARVEALCLARTADPY